MVHGIAQRRDRRVGGHVVQGVRSRRAYISGDAHEVARRVDRVLPGVEGYCDPLDPREPFTAPVDAQGGGLGDTGIGQGEGEAVGARARSDEGVEGGRDAHSRHRGGPEGRTRLIVGGRRQLQVGRRPGGNELGRAVELPSPRHRRRDRAGRRRRAVGTCQAAEDDRHGGNDQRGPDPSPARTRAHGLADRAHGELESRWKCGWPLRKTTTVTFPTKDDPAIAPDDRESQESLRWSPIMNSRAAGSWCGALVSIPPVQQVGSHQPRSLSWCRPT